MSDLIKREDAIKAIAQDLMYEACVQSEYASDELSDWIEVAKVILEDVPSADRRQGEWKPFDLTWGRSIYACSACEEAIAVPCGWSDGKPIYDYCPMCGARMKGADDE